VRYCVILFLLFFGRLGYYTSIFFVLSVQIGHFSFVECYKLPWPTSKLATFPLLSVISCLGPHPHRPLYLCCVLSVVLAHIHIGYFPFVECYKLPWPTSTLATFSLLSVISCLCPHPHWSLSLCWVLSVVKTHIHIGHFPFVECYQLPWPTSTLATFPSLSVISCLGPHPHWPLSYRWVLSVALAHIHIVHFPFSKCYQLTWPTSTLFANSDALLECIILSW
jgi:hypothetical protein